MSAARGPYRALLFDLFRTVLFFTPQAPTGQVHEPTWRGAMDALHEQFGPLLDPIPCHAFFDALVAASDDIARARAPEYLEVPIAERYARALRRVNCDPGRAGALAPRLAQIQLDAQVANTELPPEHATVLREVAARYPLALVSNFDEAAAAHAVLARHGLDRVFSSVVFSIEFGRRKPHAAIFRAALDTLGVDAPQALFIGDTPVEDVGGAAAVGMDTAWLNASGRPFPDGIAKPTYVLRQLSDLAAIVR